MKTDFSNYILPNELMESLDSTNAWAYDWVLYACPQQARIMRHQGVGNVMF